MRTVKKIFSLFMVLAITAASFSMPSEVFARDDVDYTEVSLKNPVKLREGDTEIYGPELHLNFTVTQTSAGDYYGYEAEYYIELSGASFTAPPDCFLKDNSSGAECQAESWSEDWAEIVIQGDLPEQNEVVISLDSVMPEGSAAGHSAEVYVDNRTYDYGFIPYAEIVKEVESETEVSDPIDMKSDETEISGPILQIEVKDTYYDVYHWYEDWENTEKNLCVELLGAKFSKSDPTDVVGDFHCKDTRITKKEMTENSVRFTIEGELRPGDRIRIPLNSVILKGERDAVVKITSDMEHDREILYASKDHVWDEGRIITEPDCTTSGLIQYRCRDHQCGKVRNEILPAKGHDWFPEINYYWDKDAEGNPYCEAGRVCRECYYEETVQAKITENMIKAPTETEEGEIVYTAEFDVDWAETQVRKEILPVLHRYTVSFQPNGGEGTMEAQELLEGTEFVFPECGFTPPENMEMGMWSANGYKYDVGDRIVIREDVRIYPVWQQIGQKHSITVRNGEADLQEAARGEKVTVTAVVPAGKVFEKWNSDDVTFEDPSATVTSFVMPAKDVVVSAEINDRKYPVTVTGGTADHKEAAAGEKVTVTAKVPAGGVFEKWVSNDVTFENETAQTTAFIMPEQAVSVKAQMKEKPAGGGSSGGGGGGGGGGAVNKYVVNTADAENGRISVDKETAAKGDVVLITAKPEEGFAVKNISVVSKNEDDIAVKTEKDGTYSFVMPATSVNITAEFAPQDTAPVQPVPPVAPPAETNGFADVKADAYYADAVLWAVEKGITAGVSETLFAPERVCTRAEMVTFLWRAAGSPEPKTAELGFKDVADSAYYKKAVLWAVENGITAGVSETAFAPEQTVTRGQTVSFLYRMTGAEGAKGENPFTDVKADAYYADAVLWAVKQGITAGVSETSFGPDNGCTRAQIASFLYRAMGSET